MTPLQIRALLNIKPLLLHSRCTELTLAWIGCAYLQKLYVKVGARACFVSLYEAAYCLTASEGLLRVPPI